jgi:S-DNA-T family DNA segregation ATPase FtsK/SpoIIIE
LKVGYSRAGRIIDQLEERGIIGPPNGSKPRQVYVSHADFAD